MLVKKKFVIVSLIILMTSICGRTTVATGDKAEENKIVLGYDFSGPVITTQQDYDLVQIEGLEDYLQTGAPIVPVRPVTVLVPFGKKVVSTKAIVLDKKELSGTYLLAPAQEPYPISYTGPKVQTEPDPAIYGQDASWPGMDYQEISTQSKRGYQLFTVNLFPIQYVPTTGKITYATKMRLGIELADSAAKGVLRPSEKTGKTLKREVENPDILSSYEVEAMSAEMEVLSAEGVSLSGGPYQYVIITSEYLAGLTSLTWNFQALRDNKIAHGMTATIVTTKWIYDNYDANEYDPNSYAPSDPNASTNLATEIRMFLIDAYNDWGTEYVLLGGYSNIIPVRYFRVGGTNIPADMYYGCVDPPETFNGNGNEYYGESDDGIGGNDVDLYAEIYVGRAAVQSGFEMRMFIRKTLTYDSTYDDEYLTRVSMLGEDLDQGEGHNFAKPLMEQIRLGGEYDDYFTYGFENHPHPYFYDFDTSSNLYDADGWPIWKPSNLISLMNNGRHIFNHLGHSNYKKNMKLDTSDLSSLTNTSYFFVYTQGCKAGGFDTMDCFAEVITTMRYGAFAVIMNSRSGWEYYSHRFNRPFWDAVLGQQRILEIGRANQASKEANLWSIYNSCIRYCCYELNLFGDPAQQFKFPYISSAGYVLLDDDFYACDANVAILLIDNDLQGNMTQQVTLTASGGDVETFVLDEEVPTYGIFGGIISTEAAQPNQQDGLLQALEGETITVIYDDANDGTGNPATANDTAVVDCSGPVISNVDFKDVFTGMMAYLNFETNEPATVRIECGTSCGSPDIVVKDNDLLMNHTIKIKVPQTGEYYFTIEVTDSVGNTTIDSNEGSCYRFISQPGTIIVPDDYPTIRDAMDSIPAYGKGDIVVRPGTYHENLDFEYKNIVLSSINPNNWDVVKSTVINGDGAAQTIKFYFYKKTCISGFTITGGSTGLLCGGRDSGTVKNCIIENNSDTALAFFYQGHINVDNCIVRNNTNTGFSEGAHATDIRIKNSLIVNNGTGVLINEDTSYAVNNSTIVNNDYGVRKTDSGADVSIKNCILWNHLDQLENCRATYSCIKEPNDASGTGNICGDANDPLFADSEYYHLQPTSPCIDSGKPGSYEGQTDIDGDPRVLRTNVDMGADEVPIVHNISSDIWYGYIQDAIDEAATGDEIVAHLGTFPESVDFKGKAITVRSTDPNDMETVSKTIIRDINGSTAISFTSGETSDSVLKGLTVNSSDTGIFCSSPTSSTEGPTISQCLIKNNGWGLYCLNNSPVITNNIFADNEHEAITCDSSTIPQIKNNLIYGTQPQNPMDGSGIGLWLTVGQAEIYNNTIVNNNWGIYVWEDTGTIYPEIVNCILWNNAEDDFSIWDLYDQIFFPMEVSYCCFEDKDTGMGVGNINENPLLANIENKDLHLQFDSPCIEAGYPSGNYDGQTDIDGEPRVQAGIVDMGADEAPPRVHNITKDLWYGTINKAVADANHDDVLEVHPGEYNESVDLSDYPLYPCGGKNLTIQGSDPLDWDVVKDTIVNGGGAQSTFAMGFGAISNILKGLTITGGTRGVYLTGSNSFLVSNCIITDNNTGIGGDGCNGNVVNCLINDNDDEGLALGGTTVTIRSSIVSGSQTGIEVNSSTTATICHCTVADNNDGIVKTVSYSTADIKNCIIWNDGDELYDCSATYSCIKDCNDVGDPNSTHNICDNPCFVSGDEFYHLRFISPCIDSGAPGTYGSQTDIDNGARLYGPTIDIGSDEVIYPDAHWWRLDETSGFIAHDSVNEDDGTFSEAYEPNWIDGGVCLNGISEYFSVSTLDSAYDSGDSFTVVGRFKTGVSTGKKTIIGQWSQEEVEVYPGTYVDFYYGWQVLVGGKKVRARFGAYSSYADITGVVEVNDSNWHHFALVHPPYPADSSLYVDGELDATPQSRYFGTVDTKCRIGDASYVISGVPVLKGGPFNGTIDDIMIFDHALTVEEVKQLCENGM